MSATDPVRTFEGCNAGSYLPKLHSAREPTVPTRYHIDLIAKHPLQGAEP